jgi:hypothetical protein
MNKFYLLALANTSTVDINLLLDEPSFLPMAQTAYSENDWDTALQIGLDWINENF